MREVMEGVIEWRPVGGQAEGVGAVYRVGIGAGPVVLRARLRIDEWKRPLAIGWVSESSPVANRGRWTFRPARGGTRVQLEVGYEPPGGAVGGVLAASVEPILHRRAIVALDRMKEALEAG